MVLIIGNLLSNFNYRVSAKNIYIYHYKNFYKLGDQLALNLTIDMQMCDKTVGVTDLIEDMSGYVREGYSCILCRQEAEKKSWTPCTVYVGHRHCPTCTVYVGHSHRPTCTVYIGHSHRPTLLVKSYNFNWKSWPIYLVSSR